MLPVLAALARAAAAAGAMLARSPVARSKVVQVAQKAGKAFQGHARKAVQFCRHWPDNRLIRQEYNARKPLLRKEIDRLRRQGASSDKQAEHAFRARKEARLSARETMRRNGDVQGVKDLQKRDLKKYGNKDGPTLEQLQRERAEALKKQLGRQPTRDEVNKEIVDGATRTDVVTNILYLTF